MSTDSIFYRIEKILLPTDGSEHCLKAAKYAAEIAKGLGSKITLLHVLSQALPIEYPIEIGIEAKIEVEDEKKIRERGKRAIEKTKEIFDEAAIPVEVRYFLCEDTRRVIVEMAEKEQFDLIVMGHRGLSGLKRLMLGSVAEGVCHNAQCPVLIVK